jgi:hypothetical protein
MSSSSDTRLRILVLTRYSRGEPRCARCGSTANLGIDHIRSRAERKEAGRKPDVGPRLWRRLRNEAFPDGYQVLCRPCNSSKGGYGLGRRPAVIYLRAEREGSRTTYRSKWGFTGTPEWEASERLVASDPHLRQMHAVREWQRTYEQLRREVLHRYQAGKPVATTIKSWENATKRAAEDLALRLAEERKNRAKGLEMKVYFSDRALLLRLALDHDEWLGEISARLAPVTDSVRHGKSVGRASQAASD